MSVRWLTSPLLWFRARVLHSTRAYLLRTENLISHCLQHGLDEQQQQKALIRSLHAIESAEKHLAREYWSDRCNATALQQHVETLARIRARLSSQPQAHGMAQTLRTVSNLCPTRHQLKDLDALCEQLQRATGSGQSPLPTTVQDAHHQPRG